MRSARSHLNHDIKPPPWRLTGRGHIVGLHCSRAFGQACAADANEDRGQALGGFGALMVIDYHHSDVGPYRELLLCPGRFRAGAKSTASITHIWVSTRTSVTNGRQHWGLPKEQAVFDSRQHDDGRETITVHRDGRAPLRFVFHTRGLSLPINTRLFPARWHTLEQPWKGHSYRTVVGARGRLSPARLAYYDNPRDSGFPDFTGRARRIGTVTADFELIFPVADIRRAPNSR